MEKEEVKLAAFVKQTLATFSVSFLATQTGFVCSWPSYTLANFVSNETVLSTPMTSLHISLLGSLTNIGALVATPFCGYIFNTLGRKYGSMLFGVPYILTWTIIALTKNVSLVLTALGLCGIGIAGQNFTAMYVTEITQNSIRGGLTACTAAGYFLGILISYIFGGFFSYYQVVYTHLSLSILCVVLMMLLRESPVYLVMVGKEEEAAKSIAFYRHVDVTSKEVEMEIAKIRLQLDPQLEKILQEDPEVTNELIKHKTKEIRKPESAWKFLKKSQSSKRALSTILVIMAATIMMGCIILQVYAEPLFKEAVPSMSASLCAIFVALDFLVASVLCILVIDKCGRKLLLTSTSAASGVCTLVLGLQLHIHWAPHWFTAVLIYLYTFIYTMGAAVIPFVLSAEVFLPEVRDLCNSIVLSSVWVFNFFTLVVFNPLVELVGLGPVFYCFSVICFLGAAYSQLCVPETKGLSTDEIQLLFLKKEKSPK